MAETNEPGQEMAAAEAVVEAAPVAQIEAEPAKPRKRKAKAAEDVAVEAVTSEPAVAEVQPIETAPVEVLPAIKAKRVAKAPVSKRKLPARPKPVLAEKAVPAKPVKARKAAIAPKIAKPAAIAAKPVAAKPTVSKAALKTVNIDKTVFAGIEFKPFWKETTMDMNATFGGFQEAITGAQAKAKEAFEKSQTMLGEVGDFTKGNVEAVIESGKILAGGVQEIGTTLVAEGRTAFEGMTADVKELAAAKSPTDFFKLQSEMMKKSLDSAVAYSSKNSETMLKLMTDAMAPLSSRVSLAMEKARKVAA